MPCVVADLGGTFLRCALATDDGRLLDLRRLRLADDVGARGDALWPRLVESTAAYARAHETALAPGDPLVFAFPGPVVDGRFFPAGAPTVTGSGGAIPDLASALAAACGRPVLFLNDVSAAAWYFAEQCAADRFAVVTISSGIGMKLFDRNHPRRVFDELPYAGELGHIVVDRSPDAPPCDCGGRGHLGAVASGRGFERSARREALAHPAAFAASACVTRFGASARMLSNEVHLVPAVRAGDPWACDLVRRAADPLARVLLPLVIGAGLERIVLMGGFAQSVGPYYLAAVQEAFAAAGDCGPARPDVKALFALAREGEEPSLRGAAVYAQVRARAFAS
jgi:glucokinase